MNLRILLACVALTGLMPLSGCSAPSSDRDKGVTSERIRHERHQLRDHRLHAGPFGTIGGVDSTMNSDDNLQIEHE